MVRGVRTLSIVVVSLMVAGSSAPAVVNGDNLPVDPQGSASSVAPQSGTNPLAFEATKKTYTVDVDELRKSFLDNQEVTLRLPDLGEVKVTGTKADFIEEARFEVVNVSTGEVLSSTDIEAVPMRGTLAEHPSAEVRLTFGSDLVLGGITFAEKEYHIGTKLSEKDALQVTKHDHLETSNNKSASRDLTLSSFDSQDQPTSPSRLTPDGQKEAAPVNGPVLPPMTNDHFLKGYKDSWVKMHYPSDMNFYISNPVDYITSAFNWHEAEFEDGGVDLHLDSVVELSSDPTTSDDCVIALDEYTNWLGGQSLETSVDAYQLWSLRDFVTPTGGDCFGVADPNSVNGDAQEEAASVLEGINYDDDSYIDQDLTEHRGILSGHEFTHIYGEENHPVGCPNTDCNMMDDRDSVTYYERSAYWLDSTADEVHSEVWYDSEP